jgi:purine-nucleoside phosphorylase
MPIHNSAKKEEIAKTVLMPGDPLRAKYIAENFLDDYKLVNTVRNIYAYTGLYKGKEITVMASGMGMPSMGIYSYELYDYYNVDNIIRIGSCGAYAEGVNLLDTILVKTSYTEGNFAYNMTSRKENTVDADSELNNIILNTAKENNLACKEVNVACTECFDGYIPELQKFIDRLPKELNIIASEMESFALLYTAKQFNKKAACILTVVDLNYDGAEVRSLSTEERELSLNNMIKLALDSALKL